MATTAAETIFVDTNVLVYSDVTSSPLHVAAHTRLISFQAAGHVLWVSRQVIREYLVTLTRSQVFSAPLSPAEAAASARKIANQMRVANERSEVGEQLLDLVTRYSVKGKQIHDANIVATMLAHGIKRLLTHNTADFERYRDLIELVPLVT